MSRLLFHTSTKFKEIVKIRLRTIASVFFFIEWQYIIKSCSNLKKLFALCIVIPVFIINCANLDTTCLPTDAGCHPELLLILYNIEVTPCKSQGFCYMYSADNVGAGWFSSALGGLSGVDAKCAAEKPADLPGTGSDYQALLMASGGSRDQTSNWVLFPDMEYRAQSNAVLGTTNSVSIFTFPLQSSLGTNEDIFTGIKIVTSTSWIVSSSTCADWTAGGPNANSGLRDVTTSGFISNGTFSCGGAVASLYCVQTN